MRLDRFLCNNSPYSRQRVRLLLAQGQVKVAGEVSIDGSRDIDHFTTVELMGRTLQSTQARYFMLHKPPGYLSATVDPQHPTVMELIDEPESEELHIGGRLDRSSSGLLLITNDGLWSRRITAPELKRPKVYRVETLEPISPQTQSAFARGIYLAYENLTTQPAQLEQLAARQARLTIYEGRYHQVKRMFATVGNRVTALHRESMGQIRLDPDLQPGQYRPLTAAEIGSV